MIRKGYQEKNNWAVLLLEDCLEEEELARDMKRSSREVKGEPRAYVDTID